MQFHWVMHFYRRGVFSFYFYRRSFICFCFTTQIIFVVISITSQWCTCFSFGIKISMMFFFFVLCSYLRCSIQSSFISICNYNSNGLPVKMNNIISKYFKTFFPCRNFISIFSRRIAGNLR